MTQADTERRLAVAERQVTELRVEVATLTALVGVLLHRDAPDHADTEMVARAVGVVRESRPRSSTTAHLRLVDDAGVDGRFLDEGLRRARTGRGEGR
ncbi:hypothetical protein P1P68_22265 [Streptomyces scabiei]|uniref:hypothetical protein n=1 Tax=Streptomyces scabiei TaxID=1930 RepID=UPI002990793D|nr:hypothetical protein [Streptomyces scabiei]MDW8807435.1 hypothetical protein [Streptomyces scabiei]